MSVKQADEDTTSLLTVDAAMVAVLRVDEDIVDLGIGAAAVVVNGALLLESGDYLLLESGDKLLLE